MLAPSDVMDWKEAVPQDMRKISTQDREETKKKRKGQQRSKGQQVKKGQ
jgi:hypothetical protein